MIIILLVAYQLAFCILWDYLVSLGYLLRGKRESRLSWELKVFLDGSFVQGKEERGKYRRKNRRKNRRKKEVAINLCIEVKARSRNEERKYRMYRASGFSEVKRHGGTGRLELFAFEGRRHIWRRLGDLRGLPRQRGTGPGDNPRQRRHLRKKKRMSYLLQSETNSLQKERRTVEIGVVVAVFRVNVVALVEVETELGGNGVFG